eukprot:TRINITY_DN8715_c0_g3_i1.p1 TRINITY_DN8715_c0_g3~~TRINITY_DN8715_c0_g3_i1.p1  ORF type:complete len:1056 (-),score=242.25 TRINITY_DN8715_c0_g3_i1:18-3134(-)
MMASRCAAAAGEGVLHGMVFFLHDLPAPSKRQLGQLVAEHGGATLSMPCRQVTHVVARAEEIKAKSFKLQSLLYKNPAVQIVPESFVLERTRNATKVSRRAASPPPSCTAMTPAVAAAGDALAAVVAAAPTNEVAQRPAPHPLPIVTLVLPATGPNTGDFRVAVFGLHFVPGAGAKIRFGPVAAYDYEWHSDTSVICSVPACVVPPGKVAVQASNDNGRHYGLPVDFVFYDAGAARFSHSVEQKVTVLRGQLQNVGRAITNIQRMEIDLRTQIAQLTNIKSELELPQPEPVAEKSKEEHVARHTEFEREIRVFISSPFRDMKEEREKIVKYVLPRLRKLCMSRDVQISYVDLRWGVTGAQAEQATMLLMCLREVEKSNVFVGLLGERYGWSITTEGDTSHNDLLTRSLEIAAREFPWVNEYRDRSVSELEMRMIMNHLHVGNAKPAWFYLRDPYYIDEVKKEERHLYTSEGPITGRKLVALKTDITRSGYKMKEYFRPPQMADFLFEDLQAYINDKYPEGVALSENEREELRHQLLSRNLSRVYLINENNFLELDKFVMNTTKEVPFLITGEPGSGKSALMANWIARHKEHHPEDVVVSHYIGCSPASTSYTALLLRVTRLISEQLAIPAPEATPATIAALFPSWLANAVCSAVNKGIVIAIDGLNKLDERDNALDLVWFPSSFPHNVSVIVTTTPVQRIVHTMKKRNCRTLELALLEEGERKAFVRVFLNQRAKKLTDAQEFRIASTPQTANPRFLQTLLEDISVFGEHEALDKRISQCLDAKNTAKLYELLLRRLEHDYDPDRRGVVKLFMSFVRCARRGLNLDTELAVLLEQSGVNADDWTPLFIVVEELFVSMGGVLSFANDDIAAAVTSVYTWEQGTKTSFHEKLASFFSRIEGVSDRKLEELPYQFEQTNSWDKLREFIVDVDVFATFFTPTTKFDLFHYLRLVEANTNCDLVQAFIEKLAHFTTASDHVPADLCYKVGKCFDEMSKITGAERIYFKALELYEATSMPLEAAKVKRDLAHLFHVTRRYRLAS